MWATELNQEYPRAVAVGSQHEDLDAASAGVGHLRFVPMFVSDVDGAKHRT